MKVRIEKVYDLHRIEHEEWRNGCKVLRKCGDAVTIKFVDDAQSFIMVKGANSVYSLVALNQD
jgi:hypothetical protein